MSRRPALPVLGNGVPSAVRAGLDTVVEWAMGGAGRLRPAVDVAEAHADGAADAEDAIRRLVRTHVRLAGSAGFVTGLGGVVTLPVSLPAGVAGLYVVAGRMTIGIAHLRGYDVASEEVRSAVAVCLIGAAGSEAVKRASVESSRRFLVASLRRLPAGPLLAVNRAVGFRLLTKAGSTGVVNLTKAVPLVGGVVGGAVDVGACRGIAVYAKRVFVPLGPPEGPPSRHRLALGPGPA